MRRDGVAWWGKCLDCGAGTTEQQWPEENSKSIHFTGRSATAVFLTRWVDEEYESDVTATIQSTPLNIDIGYCRASSDQKQRTWNIEYWNIEIFGTVSWAVMVYVIIVYAAGHKTDRNCRKHWDVRCFVNCTDRFKSWTLQPVDFMYKINEWLIELPVFLGSVDSLKWNRISFTKRSHWKEKDVCS